MTTVYCPVIQGQIDGDGCLEISLVSENQISERVFEDNEDKIVWNEEQRQKCLNCKWHADS